MQFIFFRYTRIHSLENSNNVDWKNDIYRVVCMRIKFRNEKFNVNRFNLYLHLVRRKN